VYIFPKERLFNMNGLFLHAAPIKRVPENYEARCLYPTNRPGCDVMYTSLGVTHLCLTVELEVSKEVSATYARTPYGDPVLPFSRRYLDDKAWNAWEMVSTRIFHLSKTCTSFDPDLLADEYREIFDNQGPEEVLEVWRDIRFMAEFFDSAPPVISYSVSRDDGSYQPLPQGVSPEDIVRQMCEKWLGEL
jgi:hypothetical protein